MYYLTIVGAMVLASGNFFHSESTVLDSHVCDRSYAFDLQSESSNEDLNRAMAKGAEESKTSKVDRKNQIWAITQFGKTPSGNFVLAVAPDDRNHITKPVASEPRLSCCFGKTAVTTVA